MRLNISLLFLILLSAGCANNSEKTENIHDALIKGRKISAQVGSTLKKELLKAYKAGGVELAIPYCNARASFLTDSFSRANQTIISRISRRNRNIKNVPKFEDIPIIKAFEDGNISGDTVITLNNELHYYRAINIEENCLKCHGENHSIENQQIISNLYPDDKATGYKIGDFRGLWKVSFVK